MEKKLLILFFLMILSLFLYWNFDNHKQIKKTVSVVEDGWLYTVTVIQDDEKVIIESKVKNILKTNKTMIFGEYWNDFYHESKNFNKYYNYDDRGYLTVIRKYEVKPNETLTDTREFKRKNNVRFGNVYIYPGFNQINVKIKI